MLKRSVSVVISCALLFQVCGCTTMWLVPLHETEGEYEGKVVVITDVGEVLKSDTCISVVQSDTLYTKINGQDTKIPMSIIRVFQTKRVDAFRTILAVACGICIVAPLIYGAFFFDPLG